MPIAANIYYTFHKGTVENGCRPPFVLIHGAGGSHLHWPLELRRLPDFRVYSLDLPGHGKSTGHGLQAVSAYAESIVSWMETVKLHRAVFVGHSMGGAIALTLGLDHQQHVLGLVLISTGARLRVHPAILENTENLQTYSTAISAILSKSFSKHADSTLLKLAKTHLETTRPSVLHGDFVACNHFDRMESLLEIRTPTLILCGQDDEMTPLRYSQFLSDNIPGASLTVIPDAGHMVMLEQPQSVAQAVSHFLPAVPFHPGQV